MHLYNVIEAQGVGIKKLKLFQHSKIKKFSYKDPSLCIVEKKHTKHIFIKHTNTHPKTKGYNLSQAFYKK